jgi:uncharacterized membrane protein YeaQ/YmgE (transglycosylase-associated protein family)
MDTSLIRREIKGATMAAIGMITLGAFIGWVIAYVLYRITDWGQPVNVLSGVISAAVAGTVFAFIKYLDEQGASAAEAIYYYPVGLAYGALVNGLGWVAGPVDPALKTVTILLRLGHMLAVLLISVLILVLLVYPSYLGIKSPGLERPEARQSQSSHRSGTTAQCTLPPEAMPSALDVAIC